MKKAAEAAFLMRISSGCGSSLRTRFRRGRASLGCAAALAVALPELLDPARGVENLLLAGVKRVAHRAHLHMQLTAERRLRLERVAAAADDGDFLVVRMDLGLHVDSFLRGR